MNNEDLQQHKNEKMPDEADEKFWQDFSRDLWLMFRKAEHTPEGDGVPADEARKTDDSIDNEKPLNLRENCLPFTRCREIGKREKNISAAERTHLEACRFCARRVEQFGVYQTVETLEQEKSPSVAASPISFWSRIYAPFDGKLKTGRLSFGLAALAALIFGGAAIIFLQTNRNPSPVEVSGLEKETVSPLPVSNSELPGNQNFNYETNNLNRVVTETNAGSPLEKDKKITSNQNSSNDNQSDDEAADDLDALPADLRAVVRESLAAGAIIPSDDLARLQNVPLRRGDKVSKIVPLAPKNEAVRRAAPVFRWQSAANREYEIIVTDDAGREVAKSEFLKQNSWQIERGLAAGFYFWKIRTRLTDSEDAPEDSSPVMFKVLSEAEKRRLETARNATGSNPVKAILLARAGLLEEAENALNAELRKNRNSTKAKKMLAQIRRWRKK